MKENISVCPDGPHKGQLCLCVNCRVDNLCVNPGDIKSGGCEVCTGPVTECNIEEEIKEDFIDDILESAEQAYFEVAEEKQLDPEQIRRLDVCSKVAHRMLQSLLQKGYNAQQELVSAPRAVFHSFITITPKNAENTDEILADPMWQQFLPETVDTPNLPGVLIGTRAEVIAQARQYGVEEEHLKMYAKHLVTLTASDVLD